jgi:Ca2+-binding EF-hand superfamily protein
MKKGLVEKKAQAVSSFSYSGLSNSFPRQDEMRRMRHQTERGHSLADGDAWTDGHLRALWRGSSYSDTGHVPRHMQMFGEGMVEKYHAIENMKVAAVEKLQALMRGKQTRRLSQETEKAVKAYTSHGLPTKQQQLKQRQLLQRNQYGQQPPTPQLWSASDWKKRTMLTRPQRAQREVLERQAGAASTIQARLRGKKVRSDNKRTVNRSTLDDAKRDQQYQDLLQAFRKADANSSGGMCRKEQRDLFTSYGKDINDPEVTALMDEKWKALDADGDGVITLEEFMIAAGYEERWLLAQAPGGEEAARAEAAAKIQARLRGRNSRKTGSEARRREEQYQALLQAFRKTDMNNNGSISPEEQQMLLVEYGKDVTDAEVNEQMDRKFRAMDGDGDGVISLEEFMTAAGFKARWQASQAEGGEEAARGKAVAKIQARARGRKSRKESKAEKREKQYQDLLALFKMADADNSGGITRDEQVELFKAHGADVNDPEVTALMDEKWKALDADGDGVVTLEEFMIAAGYEDRWFAAQAPGGEEAARAEAAAKIQARLRGRKERKERKASRKAKKCEKQYQDLLHMFRTMDMNNSGGITRDEQVELFKAHGADINDPEVTALMDEKWKALDADGDGVITLEEFMIAAGYEERWLLAQAPGGEEAARAEAVAKIQARVRGRNSRKVKHYRKKKQASKHSQRRELERRREIAYRIDAERQAANRARINERRAAQTLRAMLNECRAVQPSKCNVEWQLLQELDESSEHQQQPNAHVHAVANLKLAQWRSSKLLKEQEVVQLALDEAARKIQSRVRHVNEQVERERERIWFERERELEMERKEREAKHHCAARKIQARERGRSMRAGIYQRMEQLGDGREELQPADIAAVDKWDSDFRQIQDEGLGFEESPSVVSNMIEGQPPPLPPPGVSQTDVEMPFFDSRLKSADSEGEPMSGFMSGFVRNSSPLLQHMRSLTGTLPPPVFGAPSPNKPLPRSLDYSLDNALGDLDAPPTDMRYQLPAFAGVNTGGGSGAATFAAATAVGSVPLEPNSPKIERVVSFRQHDIILGQHSPIPRGAAAAQDVSPNWITPQQYSPQPRSSPLMALSQSSPSVGMSFSAKMGLSKRIGGKGKLTHFNQRAAAARAARRAGTPLGMAMRGAGAGGAVGCNRSDVEIPQFLKNLDQRTEKLQHRLKERLRDSQQQLGAGKICSGAGTVSLSRASWGTSQEPSDVASRGSPNARPSPARGRGPVSCEAELLPPSWVPTSPGRPVTRSLIPPSRERADHGMTGGLGAVVPPSPIATPEALRHLVV